ncbi:MAG: hypothetical protein ACI8WB_002965 [Phenylobacterium sp.]|jgi:hypothetical protein
MKQELSFAQKCRFYDKVKDDNFRESSRLEGIELSDQNIPQSPQLREQLMADLVARYTKKAKLIEGA